MRFVIPPLQGEGDRWRSQWWRGLSLDSMTPLRLACGQPPPLQGEDQLRSSRQYPVCNWRDRNKKAARYGAAFLFDL